MANGNKGKFSERIKLIVINRYKKFKGIGKDTLEKKENDNDKFVKDRVKYIKKRLEEDRESNESMGIIPRRRGIGIDNKVNIEKNGIVVKKNNATDDIKKDVNVSDIKGVINNNIVKKDNVDVVGNSIGVRDIDRSKENIGNDNLNDIVENKKENSVFNRRNRKLNKKKVGIDNIKKDNNHNDKEKLKDELGIKIIKKIRGKLDNNINELDVLESELYFFGKDNDRELELKKIQEIKNRIEDIINKIDSIKREYNILKDNYLDDIIDLDDKLLVDDIIDYKYLLDNINDNERLVKDYKLLDEYKNLCDKLDEIDSITEDIVRRNEDKVIDYINIDKRYKAICEDTIKLDDIDKNVSYEIECQNKYLDELIKKVSKIDRKEYTIYKMKGLGDLISNSLKYMGLMMVSPFLGFLPSIAASTIATKNMIKNIRNNMELEEIKKVSYEAINYNSDINNKLNDINYAYYVIDDVLSEISRLKRDFLVQYNSSIKGYDNILNNINKIENKIINNRMKVDIIKKRMLVSKKINDDKMVRVKKLNQNS